MSDNVLKRFPWSETYRPWMDDSLFYKAPDMLNLLTRVAIESRIGIRDSICTLFHLFPLFVIDEQTIPDIASSICKDAICKPRVELTSMVSSTATYVAFTGTPLVQQVI